MQVYNYFYNESKYVSDEEGQMLVDSGVWKRVPEELFEENYDEKEQGQEATQEVLSVPDKGIDVPKRGRPKKGI